MSTFAEMAEVHAVRIAERDATIASQAAKIEAYKHEAEVYREMKTEYEILLARSLRKATLYPELTPINEVDLSDGDIVWFRGTVSKYPDCTAKIEVYTEVHGNAVHPWTFPARNFSGHVEARAALQPKEGA